MHPTALALLGLLLAPLFQATSPEPIAGNPNRSAAGTHRGGVLTATIEARTGLWRPGQEQGEGVVVQAFGEAGGGVSIPGPLLRVRAGTRIELAVRNALAARLRITR